MGDRQVRVMLLCCPRSTSTLFTKAMSSVPGSQIFMNSHYYCYEAEHNLKVMGKEVDDDLPDEVWRKAAEMIVGEDCSGDRLNVNRLKFSCLKHALDNPREDAPFVFCKESSTQVVGRYDVLPDKTSQYRYTFLLRHPIRVFNSLRKALFDLVTQFPSDGESPPTWEEFNFLQDAPAKYMVPGRYFKELHDGWKYVQENLDPNPVIIDSDDVLSDPAHMLSKYCAALGIPYSDSMITWDGDPKHADEWWLPFKPFYEFQFGRILVENAVFSKGFHKPSKMATLDEVTADVRECCEFVQPYYEEMYSARLKP